MVQIHLSRKDYDEIYRNQANNKTETAGVILFNKKTGRTNGVAKKRFGDNESVLTPFGTVNFHTHPDNAYDEYDLVYGWPSGDDMREMIKFALQGTRHHLIFAQEGVYVLRMCKKALQLFRDMKSDIERGVAIAIIEAAFRALHSWRVTRFQQWSLSRNGYKLKPGDFVAFANKFNFKDAMNGRNVCGRLRCDGMPVFRHYCDDRDCVVQENLVPFLKRKKQEIYSVSRTGKDLRKQDPKIMFKYLNDILNLFGTSRFFRVSFFPRGKLPNLDFDEVIC